MKNTTNAIKAINTIRTLGVMAVMALGAGIVSCSDNSDPELEPNRTQRTLSVTRDGSEIPNHTLDLGAAPSDTRIEVSSNTRWTVEISDCLGGWCDVDVINGTGDGSFTITVLDNMKEQRDCYVTVYKTDAEGNKETDGSIQIKVVQAVSDVRLSPSSVAPFAPELNSRQKFEIVSNVAWTLDVTYDSDNATRFITIIPDGASMSDMGDGTYSGNGAALFYIDVQNNRTAADRKAFINLRSAVATYSVEITQLKSSYTFDVSPSENQVIPADGGEIVFGVLSLSNWKVVTAADWIRFSPTAGGSSEERESTVATILPNPSGMERSAVIRFIPEDKGYQEQSVTVTQRPRMEEREPAVSVPWLADGYTQTSVTVEFNYYSPFYEIVEARLQWRKAGTEEWNTVPCAVQNPTEGMVSTTLTGLDPATSYEARGCVVDRDGRLTVGTVSYPFTTAGKRPGAGDNPTPSN